MLRIARRPLWPQTKSTRPLGVHHHRQHVALFSSLPHVPLPQELRARVKEAPLASAYDPVVVEKGWQAYWQDAIKNQSAASGRSFENSDKFRMILPPPNVTGALHIGHALTITIQDALTRWHRMRGFDVHWVPGLDHAGIATQVPSIQRRNEYIRCVWDRLTQMIDGVVERKLQKEKNLSKHDLGRDAFINEVWKWNEQYGGKIMNQIDHIGAIVEKEQSYFTLDETRSKAVVEAFVQLHEKGLIYRRRRMVNWCPTLKTAISDIEVDSEQVEGSTLKTLPGRSKPVEFGVMHRIRYRVVDSDEFLEVDTTRPETIFGDVAVAVHPEDTRYQKFHGKYVLHPFSQEPIPIVTDDILVNMELGTGVVKVTPAHDPKDFECGLRCSLPEKEIIDKEGKICGSVDERFLGLDRYDAREKVVEELKDMGLYVDKLDHPTALSICSRSGNVIEPLLMPQWFVDCKHMAKRAADNVRSGKMAIEPKSHAHTWFFFLDNMQDWCVSRQLWWGHRVPAYRVKNSTNDEWFVASSLEAAREKAEQALQVKLQDSDMEQDADVLDTWFSSGLLPLSVFGWPNLEQDARVVKELEAKYPLDLMETGSDILFFWVARMAMLCEEFSGEIPFRKVLLHPMVRDKAGRKMSKSLGNVIDPLHVIDGISLDQLLADLVSGNVSPRELKKAEKELKREFPQGIPTCGTDALRFTLASYLQQGRQINMDVQRVVSYRHFCNKIWNAVRYALPLLETSTPLETKTVSELKELKDSMGLADRWIMSRLAQTVLSINRGIDSNHLATSVSSIQRFFVQELCDVYIEFSKPVLYGNRIDVSEFSSEEQLRARKLSAQATMFQCLDYSMRLLHPFIPFVTEELWQRIREYDPLKASELVDTSILFAKYPEEADMKFWLDDEAENTMMLVLDVIHGIRSLKHTIKVLAPNASTDSSVEIFCKDEVVLKELTAALRDIEGQCRISVRASVDSQSSTVAGPVLTHSVSESCRVLMQVPQDPETSKRVESEINRLEKRLAKSQKSLDGLVTRRSDPQYATKVPENVQLQDEQRLMQTQTDLHATEKSLAALRELQHHY
uniref:valine--tRNA ligase n=1 Tax=Globisporangium ultimum (strain ATCC 200006 / CBS 805.95 / DAOM BR144) TaxID=431595 RepID=K3WPL4_GLOUD